MEKRKHFVIKGILIVLIGAILFLIIGFRFLDQTDEREKRIFYNTKIAEGEEVEEKGFFIKPITIWSVGTGDLSSKSLKGTNITSELIRRTKSGKQPKEGYYNFYNEDDHNWYYIGGEDKQSYDEKREKGDYSRFDVNNGYGYLYKTCPFISLFNTTWYVIPRGLTKAYPVCRDDGTRIYTPTGDDKLNEQVKKNILSGNRVDEKLFGTPVISQDVLDKNEKKNKN